MSSTAGYTKQERLSARVAIEAFTSRKDWEPVEAEAADRFFGPFASDRIDERLEEDTLAQSENAFRSWFWFDCRLPDGRRVVECFLERAKTLSTGERLYLEQMRGSSHRLYEIEAVVPGATLTLRDLIAGTSITVQERLGSRELHKWDVLAARLALPAGASGKPEVDDLVLLPRDAKDAILSDVEDALTKWRAAHPGGDSIELFEEYVPRFHEAWLGAIVNPPIPKLIFPGGEEALITRVHFDVEDREGVVAALDGARDMERFDDRPAWNWRSPKTKAPPTSLYLNQDALVLEALTQGAAERAVRRIERLLKDGVRKGLTSHESLAQAIKRGPRETADSRVDVPEADEMVLDHYARHYRAWLDEPVPALAGASPREAARSGSESQRHAVVELLKGLEQMYARGLVIGDPAYDPFWMWEELELSERPEAPRKRKEPPPLGHESLTRLVPGLAAAAQGLAARIRRRAQFDVDSVVTEEDLSSDLAVRRFLVERGEAGLAFGLTRDEAATRANLLGAHLTGIANYELHHRKTFWIEDGLAWMLARTNLDIQADALRLPFSSFALVFTDRDTLAVAERLLSKEASATHRGRVLSVLTVYATTIPAAEAPGLSLSFLFDDLSEDWPYLLQRALALDSGARLEALLASHLPDVDPGQRDPVFTSAPFNDLVKRALNAILYATSAGAAAEP